MSGRYRHARNDTLTGLIVKFLDKQPLLALIAEHERISVVAPPIVRHRYKLMQRDPIWDFPLIGPQESNRPMLAPFQPSNDTIQGFRQEKSKRKARDQHLGKGLVGTHRSGWYGGLCAFRQMINRPFRKCQKARKAELKSSN